MNPAGVRLEWLDDHSIACFTLPDISRPTLDQWCDLVIQVVHVWPEDRTYRALHDASSPGIGLTPYLQHKISEIDSISQHLHGRVAFVSAKSFVAQIAQFYSQRTQRNRSLSAAIFFDQDQALAWLRNAQ